MFVLILLAVQLLQIQSAECAWKVQGASFDLSALQKTFTTTGGDIDCTT